MPPTLREHTEGAIARALLRLPLPWIERAAGPLRTYQGATLDPQVSLAIRLQSRLARKPVHALGVRGARLRMHADMAVFAPVPPPLDRVEDILLPGPCCDIPARVYRPRNARRPSTGIVYLHGGGTVTGSIAAYDAPCRALAADSKCVVVSIEYRLAPEHPFPAPVDDAVAAFREVASAAASLGLDPARLVIAGDSAGGMLSAVVALETREDAVRPCLQVLIYPAVDLTASFPSVETLGTGLFLEKASIEWFTQQYLRPGQDRRDPRVSPLFSEDCSGAPPAFVLTAGFDPLRDEGEAYAERLRRDGVTVEHRCYDRLPHGFFNLSGVIVAAREPVADLVAAARQGSTEGLARQGRVPSRG